MLGRIYGMVTVMRRHVPISTRLNSLN